MAVKPIILTVDDEPHVLNAIERDLRQRYGREYRIVKALSGAEALDTARHLKERNSPVALFLADQRMPGMSGVDFLSEAVKLWPEARKVLLTAYADTQAAIVSINVVGLDYYLMKPWDPPEDRLFPVLDDLLSDWRASVPLPYDGIRVAGTLWSPGSHQVKDFLARNRIAYQWLDIEKDGAAREMVEALKEERYRLPVLYFPDGTILIEPDNRTLAAKVGLRTHATQPFFDLVIIGAGPAGLGAAVYGASEGLRTLLIEKAATGGQAGTSSRIDNYLGFPQGVSGSLLAQRATLQAERLGAEILTTQEVCEVRVQEPYRVVQLRDGGEVSCHALLVATGVSILRLRAPGVEPLVGAGVYYGAAVTEAASYRGEHVLVIGGANSAGQGALFFSRYAGRVTMLVRASSLEKGMSQYLVDQIRSAPNITVRLLTEVVSAHGSTRLEEVSVVNKETGERETIAAAAMFVFIGAVPHSEAVAAVVECNAAGFILTGADLLREGRRPRNWTLQRDPFMLESSVPGIFAAGDVRHGAVRRVASAVGEGAIAVSVIHQYLKSV